jgi:hypothetical protein
VVRLSGGRLVRVEALACRGDRRAPFGLGLDHGQGGRDRLLPAIGDQLTPPLSDSPEVGADLPLVGQQRATACCAVSTVCRRPMPIW